MKSSQSRFCSNCIIGFIVICFCPIFIGIICSLLFDVNEGENKIDFQSMSQEIENSLQYQLIGQHLVIDAIKGDFKLSLINSSVKSAILLLVGPSGSGKSFTRKILEGAFHEHGFKIVQRFNDPSPVNLGLCESSPFLEENSNILFVFEDADRELLEVMDVAYRVTASTLVSKCNKVIIIIVTSVYGDETKRFMSERCLFGEQRLRIDSGNLLSHLSLTVNELALTDRQEKNSKIIPLLYLPLDKEHLRICIQRQLSKRNIVKEEWEHITRKVLAQMDFYPDCEMMFSESGCKLVSSRIDYVLGNDN
ncbi:torsin-2A-like [Rhopilema esculentum]|uniref:torsin-2A-like n=1 Tax=Rhopilema esculentum TaxID=499914 RepID=UPI0031CFC957